MDKTNVDSDVKRRYNQQLLAYCHSNETPGLPAHLIENLRFESQLTADREARALFANLMRDNEDCLVDEIHSGDDDLVDASASEVSTHQTSHEYDVPPFDGTMLQGSGGKLVEAVHILRAAFCGFMAKKHLQKKPLYPGRAEGGDPLEYFTQNYGEDVASGALTAGSLAIRDKRLYDALNAVAKKQASDRTVKDLFFDMGSATGIPMSDRTRAAALILGDDVAEAEAVQFFKTLALERIDEPARPRGTYDKARDRSGHAPSIAPALWLDAKLSKADTPPEFIKRHYEPWLGKGFTRADLRRLDKALYMALSNWLRHNEMPADVNLSTLKDETTRWVDEVRNSEKSDVRLTTAKEARRFASAIARR